MNPLANTAQMELAKIAKISATHTVSQNPITNLLTDTGFKEVQHFPGTDLTYTAEGALSFSVEVDGACTLTFEEYESDEWIDISGTYGSESTAFTGDIDVSGITTFTNYRGLLTLTTADNNVRLTITATYPMKSRYRALFGYTYADESSVPWYRAYIPYVLPSDYMEFNKIMRTYDDRRFQENTDFILTPDKKVYLSWFLTGEFDIHYWRFPTTIDNDTEDSYEFELPEDAQAYMPWFIGGYAIMPDNASIGVQLLNQYYELKDSLTETDNLEITTLQATWG
jgi:hypothetical protein